MKKKLELIDFSPDTLNKIKVSGLTCDITSDTKTVTLDDENPDDMIRWATALEGVKKYTVKGLEIHLSKEITLNETDIKTIQKRFSV